MTGYPLSGIGGSILIPRMKAASASMTPTPTTTPASTPGAGSNGATPSVTAGLSLVGTPVFSLPLAALGGHSSRLAHQSASAPHGEGPHVPLTSHPGCSLDGSLPDLSHPLCSNGGTAIVAMTPKLFHAKSQDHAKSLSKAPAPNSPKVLQTSEFSNIKQTAPSHGNALCADQAVSRPLRTPNVTFGLPSLLATPPSVIDLSLISQQEVKPDVGGATPSIVAAVPVPQCETSWGQRSASQHEQSSNDNVATTNTLSTCPVAGPKERPNPTSLTLGVDPAAMFSSAIGTDCVGDRKEGSGPICSEIPSHHTTDLDLCFPPAHGVTLDGPFLFSGCVRTHAEPQEGPLAVALPRDEDDMSAGMGQQCVPKVVNTLDLDQWDANASQALDPPSKAPTLPMATSALLATGGLLLQPCRGKKLADPSTLDPATMVDGVKGCKGARGKSATTAGGKQLRQSTLTPFFRATGMAKSKGGGGASLVVDLSRPTPPPEEDSVIPGWAAPSGAKGVVKAAKASSVSAASLPPEAGRGGHGLPSSSSQSLSQSLSQQQQMLLGPAGTRYQYYLALTSVDSSITNTLKVSLMR